MAPRFLELYSGIGGFAAALAGRGLEVVAAVEISPTGRAVYRENFPHPVKGLNLEFLQPQQLAAYGADGWWLSPPCQPYTRRGAQRDDRDPRAASLLHLIDLLAEHSDLRPQWLGLENVPEFVGSNCHRYLRQGLKAAGYQVREDLLCPTELGLPMRRKRLYLWASREALPARQPPTSSIRPLKAFLDPDADEDPTLRVGPELLERYTGALDMLDREKAGVVTACFTAAYGRSPVRSGSYLRCAGGVRRFSPGEILRLLGFPAAFRWPAGLTLRQRWRLAGNSLSVDAVRYGWHH